MAKGRKKGVATRAARRSKAPQGEKASRPGGRIEVFVNGVPVEVSPELKAAVERAQKGLLQPQPAEMTTTQAAAFLDVSRPFVINLTRRGELPCRMVGRHRRIPTGALRDYKEKMFREAKGAADELTRMSQDLGLYDLQGSPPNGP
jgi:excisionase family DNA binding protein